MAKIIQCRHTFQITRPECRACNGQKRSCLNYDAQIHDRRLEAEEAEMKNRFCSQLQGKEEAHG